MGRWRLGLWRGDGVAWWGWCCLSGCWTSLSPVGSRHRLRRRGYRTVKQSRRRKRSGRLGQFGAAARAKVSVRYHSFLRERGIRTQLLHQTFVLKPDTPVASAWPLDLDNVSPLGQRPPRSRSLLVLLKRYGSVRIRLLLWVSAIALVACHVGACSQMASDSRRKACWSGKVSSEKRACVLPLSWQAWRHPQRVCGNRPRSGPSPSHPPSNESCPSWSHPCPPLSLYDLPPLRMRDLSRYRSSMMSVKWARCG